MLDFASVDLTALYSELNAEFFEGVLPPCQMRWSRRLRRAAGQIRVETREIQLSLPLLVDMWQVDSCFEVCGVLCDTPAWALREILKHEMIHLWLHVQKLPCGHTPAFRAKARQLGQPKIRHSIARPAPQNGWIYACAACGASFPRRRRYSRPVACASCCKTHSGGQFDARFRLKGRKIAYAHD